MSNSELKLYLETLENEFNAKKNELIRLSEEIEKIKTKYNNVNNELCSRNNLFL